MEIDLYSNMKWILEEICKQEYYDINPDEVIKRNRKRPYPEIRAMVFAIIKERFHFTYSLKKIGEFFGFKDHCPVLYGVNITFKNLYETNSDYRNIYNKIKKNFETIRCYDEVFTKYVPFHKPLYNTVFLGYGS